METSSFGVVKINFDGLVFAKENKSGVIIRVLTALSQNFDELLYSHTMRNDNQAAHSPARYAIGISDFLV